MTEYKIINADCLNAMREMEDNSIDFVVCDPPYFLTNNSGSGFMGKSWDSIHGLSKYLWESNTFVNSAINILCYCMIELNMEEGSIVLPTASMQLSEKAKKNLFNAQLAQTNSSLQNVPLKDSADLLVLTKREVWDLLRELSPNHTQTVDKYLNGVSENVVFAVPIILLVKALNNIALMNVMQKPKVKDIEAKEILLSSMDQAVLKNAIEGMIGTRLESLSTNEINGHVNTASSIAKEKKFNVITLSHIRMEDLTTWITSLLCVINATLSSNTIQNYLIQNFYKQIFKECLRVVKPGSMIAVFGGTRTVHRLTCGIEDTGFIIKDVIMWIYGSGFPKSHNISKGIDKSKRLEREKEARIRWDGKFDVGVITEGFIKAVNDPSLESSKVSLSELEDLFSGYGTSLKPAYEPIIIAMKPLDGTFAQNAEKWGVAGINIESSRIGINGATKRTDQAEYPKNEDGTEDRSQHWARTGHNIEEINKGRWPANLIFDEEAAKELDEMTGISKSSGHIRHNTMPKCETLGKFSSANIKGISDSGGASRFFYCAKASSSERNKGLEVMPMKETHRLGAGIGEGKHPELPSKGQNTHPTVKPIALMKYIIKLLAPPGNPILLDPFCGSGSTLVASKELGISAIGIEKEAEYAEIAQKRLDFTQTIKPKELQNDLFTVSVA